MLVLMAIDTQQLPVAAIQRIVVVIVVLVMHRQFAQANAGKFTTTSSTNVWEKLERAFAIRGLAFSALPARIGYDAVESRLIRS